MIRFVCPVCQEALKAPDKLAGANIKCPYCMSRCPVPQAPTDEDDAAERTEAIRPRSLLAGLASGCREFFATLPPMSDGLRWGLVALAVLVPICLGLGLYLRYTGPEEGFWTLREVVEHAAFFFGAAALVGTLFILYGHGTSCPKCEGWFAREDQGSELIKKEHVRAHAEQNGQGVAVHLPPSKRIQTVVCTYREAHVCRHCGHRWSSTLTQEEDFATRSGSRPKKNYGRMSS